MTNFLLMSQWGPSTWKFLHAVSFAYPDTPSANDKKQMYELLLSVGKFIPCKKCSSHFMSHLRSTLTSKELSYALANRDTLSRFLVDVHNEVNTRLGKKSYCYERVLRLQSTHKKTGTPPFPFLLLFVGLIVLCVWRSTRLRA